MSTADPRILAIAPLTLVDPPNGGTLRTWAVARALAEVAPVDLVAPDESVAPAGCAVELHAAGRHQPTRFQRLRAHAAGGPFDGAVARANLGSTVARLLGERRYGVCVLEHLAAGHAFAPAAARADVPFVLDLHNIDAQRARARAEEAESPGRRAVLALDARRTLRAEKRACRAAAAVVAVSDAEADIVRARGGRLVLLCPNGVRSDLFELERPPHSPGWTFVGDLGYAANVRGVRWFLEHVLPLLPADKCRPISIVGRNVDPSLRDTIDGFDDVQLVPDPPDVAPVLGATGFCFNPAITGAGTSLKILEYAAAGRPFVSTGLGVRGLPFDDPRVVADTPAAFARCMLALDGAPTDAQQLAGSLRDRARQFTWHEVLTPLREHVARLLGADERAAVP